MLNIIRLFSVFVCLVILAGCASSGVEVRRYVEVKDRVDQEMEGNAGFLSGTPQPEDRSKYRPTRKVYVVEVSQDNPEGEVIIDEGNAPDVDAMDSRSYDQGVSATTSTNYASDNYIELSRDEAAAPYIEDNSVSSGVVTYTEYTVKKDDTLQKISKKFYDSYSKWPKIYDANKSVIKNPDRIQPGITLQIPSE